MAAFGFPLSEQMRCMPFSSLGQDLAQHSDGQMDCHRLHRIGAHHGALGAGLMGCLVVAMWTASRQVQRRKARRGVILACATRELQVFCINLDDFEDRWEHSKQWAASTPSVQLSRIAAVDGRKAPGEELLTVSNSWQGRGSFEPGMWGVFLSHVATWRSLCQAPADLEYAVVVEDDAEPHKPAELANCVHSLNVRLQDLPEGWDLVLLGEHEWMAQARLQRDRPLDNMPLPGEGDGMVDRVFQRLISDKRRQANSGSMADQAALYRVLCKLHYSHEGNQPPRLLHVGGEFEGTHGLLWSRRGASRALALFERDGVRDQVDAMITRWASQGELVVLKTFPPLVNVNDRLGSVSMTQPYRDSSGVRL